MKELIERIAREYNVTEEQASHIIRLLQSPYTVESKFWEIFKEIVEKRIKGQSII